MGLTSEAVERNSSLVGDNEDRAWSVWNEPPETLPNVVIAFRIIFLTPELVIPQELRTKSEWKDVIFLEAAPTGKMTVVTLFITKDETPLVHDSEPSITLASFSIGNGRWGQVVAHGELAGTFPDLIRESVEAARKKTETAGISIPQGAYIYIFGEMADGSRYLCGSRL